MYYYKHKKTGQIIGSLHNLRDSYDADGNRVGCFTDVVMPNVCVGNGIICHIMDYRELKKGYKRTNKAEALAQTPDFGQLRHIDDKNNWNISYLGDRYNKELLPIREKGIGISFKK